MKFAPLLHIITYDSGCVVCSYLVVSCSAFNIRLCVCRYLSFICQLSLLFLFICYFSMWLIVFLFCEFLCVSVVHVMVQYLCPLFNVWFEDPELLLLFLIACIHSSCLVWNSLLFVLHVWEGSVSISFGRCHFFLYISVRGCCLTRFCIVFCLLNDIFILVALNNFVISNAINRNNRTWQNILCVHREKTMEKSIILGLTETKFQGPVLSRYVNTE
jgi:hypothetical protein